MDIEKTEYARDRLSQERELEDMRHQMHIRLRVAIVASTPADRDEAMDAAGAIWEDFQASLEHGRGYLAGESFEA